MGEPELAARQLGTAVVGVEDGRNRFPAAYVLDVARLYRLAVEKAEPNAKYHAVAEEGVAICAEIGSALRGSVHGVNVIPPPTRFELGLALLGCSSPSDVTRAHVR